MGNDSVGASVRCGLCLSLAVGRLQRMLSSAVESAQPALRTVDRRYLGHTQADRPLFGTTHCATVRVGACTDTRNVSVSSRRPPRANLREVHVARVSLPCLRCATGRWALIVLCTEPVHSSQSPWTKRNHQPRGRSEDEDDQRVGVRRLGPSQGEGYALRTLSLRQRATSHETSALYVAIKQSDRSLPLATTDPTFFFN